MQKLNLQKIIDQNGLDPKEVAKQMFPENKYPEMALKRVLKGEALLNSDQISKLSLLTNISISELYGLNWKASKKGDTLTLVSGDYKALLDTNSWTTRIFDSESLFHESIIHSGIMPLSKYLHAISEIVANHKAR
jgi:hypothetical protein